MACKSGDLLQSDIGFPVARRVPDDGEISFALLFDKVLHPPVSLLCLEQTEHTANIAGIKMCWKCLDLKTNSIVYVHLGLLTGLVKASGVQIISPE